MKELFFIISLLFISPAFAGDNFDIEPMCKVKVCNKIERFSLDIFAHMRDNMGETCMDVIIPKSEAHVGNKLSDESRWYQGSSINPTKRSVTRVTEVYKCQKDQ